MSPKVELGVFITSVPKNGKVGEILKPPLKATLHMDTLDAMVGELSNVWAQVDVLDRNGGDMSANLAGNRTALPGDLDRHYGKYVSVDFQFGDLKILWEGRYKFRVTLHHWRTDESGATTNEDLNMEAESQSVTITPW